jgi:hypothetical protein
MSSLLLRSIALCIAILSSVTAFAPLLSSAPTQTTARSAIAFPQFQISNPFTNKQQQRCQLKSQILTLASQTSKGLIATPSQQEEMERLFIQLEQLNPTSNPLKSKNPSVNGDWELKYTTSDSILGKGDFPRIGPIVQSINTDNLSAKNSEVVRYFIIDLPRSVTAELSPVNGRLTDVQFKRFSVGPLGFDAPDSFRGSLDVTYLDEDMRLTRGDKGNIFVLTRM